MKRVLILSVTAGQGHNATALAIGQCFEKRGCEYKILDTYKYLNKALGKTVDKGYLLTVSKAKKPYKMIYRSLEKRSSNAENSSISRLFNNVFSKRLYNYIKSYAPDVILCTHVFTAMLLDIIKVKYQIPQKTYAIVTDFTMHPYWEECLHLDYIITACEEMKPQALKKGFRSEQILSIGIPIQEKFLIPTDKETMLRELGLTSDKPILLIMGGSMGYGKLDRTILSLDHIAMDIQIIVVCGNNKKAKETLEKISFGKKVVVLGFVDYVEKLMDISDCVVTKPGGLTTSEALAKHLPMVIVNPIPGHEERNAEMLLNCGAAMSVSKNTSLENIIHQIFIRPERIALMKEAAKLLGKPNAVIDLCQFVLDHLEEKA